MMLSVVIATYNRAALLRQTLRTVLDQSLPRDQYEVIVVDDGSTTPVAADVPGVTVVRQPNRGPAAARNRGAAIARGDVLLFLDDDLLCSRDLVLRHLEAQAERPGALVFGPIEVAETSRPGLAADWTRAHTREHVDRLMREREPRVDLDAYVDANSSVARATFVAHGGFDERLTRQRETAELGWRLWRAGVQFVFEPRALAHHVYTKDVRELVERDAPLYGEHELLLCRRHPELRRRSPLGMLGGGSPVRRALAALAVASPVSPDPVVAPVGVAAERLRSLPAARSLGLALLSARQGVAAYRGAARAAGGWPALRREFGLTLPVLCCDQVGPEELSKHLAWLTRARYVGIRPTDWLGWLRDGAPLPDRPVILTFDAPGRLRAALPTLLRSGFPAAVFVDAGVAPGEIRAWSERGIEVGVLGCPFASAAELSRRGASIAAAVGTEPIAFAYSGGSVDPALVAVAGASFPLCFTREEGLNALRSDPARLHRTMLRPGDTVLDLAARVGLGWSPTRRRRSLGPAVAGLTS